MSKFVLPIGFIHGEEKVIEVPVAETSGESEKIFTKKPKKSAMYSWFGSVLSIAIEKIGREEISAVYAVQKDKNKIPDAIKKIPLIDVGSLLIQVQRELWEDNIPDQELKCKNCAELLRADVDLNRIEIPGEKNPDREPILSYSVKLSKTYTIPESFGAISEAFKEFVGLRFNHIRFRTATLEDAIKHEAVNKDEVVFWRNIAFDTMEALYFKDDEEGTEIEEVPARYITMRGKNLLAKDFNTKTLRELRKGMQVQMPSAKYFYEEECPECNQPTPFFASVGNFFMV